METKVISNAGFDSFEPISGYKILERIGSGGYGDVWKAEAPGGLVKAVKVIFGQHDDVRASRELKSLNRIKDAHHPFLLSLERIEVVQGCLVIVTELADGSLEDRFDQCLTQGKTGIPREELLVYLRDAADGLDYIFQQHGLQHLDVKPANLLLLGGRVKVADFGLIKNLREDQVSMSAGLTPNYAPPEVFDNKPNRHSDQYSLAIVFQQMLTGNLPFEGQTATQLAVQHLHRRPDLSRLPRSDQPIISRALSKNPEKRFPNCCSLIENLLHAPDYRTRRVRPQSTDNGSSSVSIKRETAPIEQIEVEAACRTKTLVRIPRDVTPLPALEPATVALPLQPTIFLGAGGTAARTFRHLRRRLCDRFGDWQETGQIQMLLVDTDIRALADATRGEDAGALHDSQTLALPLRPSKDYRAQSEQLLQWMSRRWLYNIPRSLRTEGLRPLGRLAFVDHSDAILGCLRQRICTAMKHLGDRVVGPLAGLPAPRVFVVGSLAGGTASGMLLDLAYAVRTVLAQQGLSDERVCGILAHSTPRQAKDRDLAIANTYAALSELYQFCVAGGYYPGDRACDLPAYYERPSAFQSTYVVHLGDDLNETGFETRTGLLAEYLYRCVVPGSADVLDQIRALEPCCGDAPLADGYLRTFGIASFGSARKSVPESEVERICRTVVHHWRGSDDVAANERSDGQDAEESKRSLQISLEQMQQCGLESDQLRRRVTDVVEDLLEQNLEVFLDQLVAESIRRDERAAATGPGLIGVVEAVDRTLGIVCEPRREDGTELFLADQLCTTLRPWFNQLGKSLAEWMVSLVDRPELRVRGAHLVVDALATQLDAVEQLASQRQDSYQRQLEMFVSEVSQKRPLKRKACPADNLEAQAKQYARLRLQQLLEKAVSDVVRGIAAQVHTGMDRLQELAKDLNQLADEFSALPSVTDCVDRRAEISRDARTEQLLETLRSRQPWLSERVDRELSTKFFDSRRRLSQMLGHMDSRQRLKSEIRRSARNAVLQVVKKFNVELVSRDISDLGSQAVQELINQARPRFTDSGGAQRLLVIAPDDLWDGRLPTEIQRASGQTPTRVSDVDGDVVVCYDREQVALQHVAANLIGSRRDYIEIAKRLHSRTDVDWSSLSEFQTTTGNPLQSWENRAAVDETSSHSNVCS